MLHFVFAYPSPPQFSPLAQHDKMLGVNLGQRRFHDLRVLNYFVTRPIYHQLSRIACLGQLWWMLDCCWPSSCPVPHPPLLYFSKGRKNWNRKLKLCRAPATNWFPQSFGNFQGVVTFPKMFRNFLSTLSLSSLSFPIPSLSHRFPFKPGKKKQQQQHACLGFPSLTWLLFFLLFFFLHSLLVFCCVCVCVCHNKMAPCVCVCAASLSNWLRPGLAALWARSTQIRRQVGGVWRGRR